MDNLSALNDTTLVSSTSTSSTSTSDTDSLEEDKIEFLNLLLTQLENQDPLDPMDVNEWTSQLVAYSQLEQQMEINDTLSSLSTQITDSVFASSLSYVGQTVELNSDMAVVQDDAVNWAYSVDGTASNVYLTITDESGEIVWEGEGSTSSGAQTLSLEASDLDAEYGDLFTLSVSATDSAGEALDTSVTSLVVVDGVQSEDGTIYLSSGSLNYEISDILKSFV